MISLVDFGMVINSPAIAETSGSFASAPADLTLTCLAELVMVLCMDEAGFSSMKEAGLKNNVEHSIHTISGGGSQEMPVRSTMMGLYATWVY